jgi:4-hydroxybenzoate polyprenyltransferase
MTASASSQPLPYPARAGTIPALCVDLDGTLIATDLLHESLILLARQKPWYLLLVPFWIFLGKAHLKRCLAERVTISFSTLPYRETLVGWLRQEREIGRSVYLVTASDESLAAGVANHLGFFSGWFGSDGTVNLSGARKRKLLVDHFGERGFDYAGNSAIDLEVWRHASRAVVVSSDTRLVDATRKQASIDRTFATRRPSIRTILKGIRTHQWIKNILVGVVLVASHKLLDLKAWQAAAEAFFALSFCASAIYVVNDLLDLESDRRHPTKRRRPFASGELPVAWGVALVPVLLGVGLAIGYALPRAAFGLLAIYPAISLLYSWFLKRKILVDVFTLSLLYTIRIVLGGAATGVACSSWLMGFSMFFFLSLAFAKRGSELFNLVSRRLEASSGRAYFTWDLAQMHSFGIASAFAAGIVFALYIHSNEILLLYREPNWLWIAVMVLVYWQCRICLLVGRGALDEDPVVFAARDRVTYAVGFVVALSAWLASKGFFPVPGLLK